MSSFAVLCSGQGGQAPDLFERFPFAEKGRSVKQQVLDSGCLSPEVTQWLKNPRADPNLIYQDHYAQPLLCLFQAMVWAELSDRLPTPQFVAGYSLGELSAYGCAGVLAPKDTIDLATARAHFMDTAAPVGSLIAVSGLAVEKAAEIAARHEGYVAIIIRNDHCLLGCLAEKAEALASAAATIRTECCRFSMSPSLHTPPSSIPPWNHFGRRCGSMIVGRSKALFSPESMPTRSNPRRT